MVTPVNRIKTNNHQLPIDKHTQVVAGEEFVSDVPELLGCEGFDAAVEGFGGVVLAIVQVGLAHAEGGVLEVVGGYAHLPDELFLGGGELKCGERALAQAVEFLHRELDAAVGLIGIGAEVDIEDTRVGIVYEVALYIIYQARLFAQGEVEAAVHAGTSQHIVQ